MKSNLTLVNKSSRHGSNIMYIVIHYTGNKGDTADNNAKYFKSIMRNASAHYFVDDKGIVQVVEDHLSAWHVGDGKGRYGITNRNSIGIEMCGDKQGNISLTTRKNTLELTKYLQQKYSVPNARVLRHYDASRKNCPSTWSVNNWQAWKDFKNLLQGVVETNAGEKEYFEFKELKIIKVAAERIYIQQLYGKTLREVGAFGINGAFFNTSNPADTKSTWGIAINKDKPIGENANINHHKKDIKRATLIFGEDKLTVERINNIDEVKRKVNWAIGGVGLFPSYDPKLEKVPADILRTTAHTAIGFKGKEVYLIVSKNISISNLRKRIEELELNGAILLDGGVSTQMLWKDNKGIHTSRKLNSIVGVKAK